MARRTGSTIIDLGTRLSLAAFGKHPGWNDHIDDLGVETDRLVAVKRALYSEGIAGNIDSGTWDNLDPARRVEGFDHTFVWRGPDGLVTGRIWSSSDGKGRRKYPMILAVQTEGLPLRFVTERVLPRLRQLEDECRAAESAGTVISLVDAARTELRREADRAGRVLTEPLPPPAAVSQLADRDPLGPEREGLVRVLYQLDRDFSSFRRPNRGESGTRSRTMDTRPQTLRVPRVSGELGEEWGLWLRLVTSELDPLSPVLCITAEGRAWTDLIVGEPGPGQLACLQQNEEALPLTTSIPYTIDGAFRRHADELVERGRQGQVLEHDPGYVAASADRIAQLARAATGGSGGHGSASGGSSGGMPKGVMVGIVIAAVVLAGILVAVVVLGGGQGRAPRVGNADGAAVSQAETDEGAGEPMVARVGGPTVEAFTAWCADADAWLGVLVQRTGALRATGDAHLIAVADALDRAGPEVLDPFRVFQDPPRTRTAMQLAEQVRAGEHAEVFASAETRSKVERGREASQRIASMLSPEGWAAASSIETLASEMRSLGLTAQAQVFEGLVDKLENGNGAERLDAATLIADAGGASEQVAADLRAIRAAARAGASSGDAALAGLPELAEREIASSLASMSGPGELERVRAGWASSASAARDLSAFLDERWVGVDRAAFEAGSSVHRAGSTIDSVQGVRRWLAEASDPRYAELDPALDPRRGAAFGVGLATAAAQLEALERQWGADPTVAPRLARLAERVERVRTDWDELDGLGWGNATRGEVEAGTEAVGATLRAVRGEINGLSAELAGSIEEYFQGLPDEVSPGGFRAVDAAWVRLRDGLAQRVAGADDPAPLRSAAEALRAELIAMEARLDAPVWPAADGSAVDVGAFRAAWRSAADAAIGRAVEAAGWDGRSFASATGPGVIEALAWAQARGAELAEMAADLVVVSRWLEAGRALADRPGGDGPTAAQLIGRWENSPVLGDERLARAVAPLLALADQIREASRSEDLAGLVGLASREAFPVGLAAWRRVVELSDRVGPGLLADANAASQRLGAEASVISEGGRTAAVNGELVAGRRALWVAAAANAGSRERLADVAALRGEMGVSVEGLPAGLRHDVALLELAARVREAAVARTPDDEVRALATPALGVIEAAASAAGAPAEARARARAELEDSGDAAPPLDPASVGPGRVGWAGEQLADGRLRYRSPGAGRVELTFRAVTPEGGEPVFVGDHELPVSALGVVLADERTRAGVLALLPEDWGAVDPRVGPRTWSWGDAERGRSPVVAGAWLRGGAEGVTLGPDDARGPGGASPLNRVSRAAALGLARALGCRLPTAVEWAAALAEDAGADPASWNLRDLTFAAQRDRVRGIVDADPQKLVEWPDEGIFLARSETVPGDRDAETYQHADGVLWFRDAGERAGGESFANIVGNVAEFVADYWEGSGAARGDAGPVGGVDADGVTEAVRSGAVRVRVIGGSALGPPSIGEDATRDMDRYRSTNRFGFADVGLRLAFGTGGQGVRRPLAARLWEALASMPLLSVDETGGRP